MEQILLSLATGILKSHPFLSRLLYALSPESWYAKQLRDVFVSAVHTLHRANRERINLHKERELARLLCETDYRQKKSEDYSARRRKYRPEKVNDQEIDAQLSQLPILSRESVRKRMREVSVMPYSSSAWIVYTSGSTGSPLSFLIDKELFAERALAIDYMLYTLTGRSDHRILRLAYNDMPWSGYQGFFCSYSPTRPETLKNLLKERNPDVLYGTTSRVELFADYLAKNFIQHPFNIILTRSEGLTASMRRRLEAFFHAKVYNIYASREFGPLGQECRMQNGFHINEDRVCIEVVDEEGKLLPGGEPGELLVTSLHNRATHFIRYAIGDRGRLATEPCPCGLNTVRLFVEGRNCDFLVFPNGRKYPFSDLSWVFNETMSIKFFQCVQPSERELIVKIVPDESYSFSIVETIQERIMKLLSLTPRDDFEVKIELVREIPLLPSGKRRVFVPLRPHNS